MNSKQKGNIGVGQAIAYFTLQGTTVSIPINDSQDYDLVIDMEGLLHSVQVKYTSEKANSGFYKVSLRSISGSSKEAYKTVKETSIDFLFIVTETLDMYLVPIIDITQASQITLNKEFSDKYGIVGERLKPVSC